MSKSKPFPSQVGTVPKISYGEARSHCNFHESANCSEI
jgi:hypothetical protein